MPAQAVAYLRSSKDRSDVSIAAQRRALHDLAASRNLSIAEEYVDAVESGKDEDRPGFQRLLRDLKAPGRAWRHVLVLDTSRIARRRHLAFIFEHECDRRGVSILYRNVPDTDPITTMLLKSILQAMDEWHSLTSKAKGLAGMAENVRQGWRAGGRAPRGYQLEQQTTGAIRDGQQVMKSRLVIDPETAPMVTAYLTLRAAGVARAEAIRRCELPWPASSVQSMDWQALTYAGHTVWNMHAERQGGRTLSGEKRRPRSEWLVQRHTHEPLITDVQAEAILAQVERAATGRRQRGSPLLFSGLVETPDGTPWHSDGSGCYRVGKGRKISARRLEAALLERIEADLMADAAIEHMRAAMMAPEVEPPSPQRIAGAERRIAALAKQISRTVDLAAQVEDTAPILRRVAELEHQRALLIEQLDDMRAAQLVATATESIGTEQIRALLHRHIEELREAAAGGDIDHARLAIADTVGRVILCPETMMARIEYRVSTGDKVASRTERHQTPALWTGTPVSLRRAA